MTVTPPELQQYLKGMDYPAGKDDLMSKARENNAPEDVIELISRLPDQSFNTPVDVSKAVGKIE